MFLKNRTFTFMTFFVKMFAKMFFLFKVRGAGAGFENYCWSRSHIFSDRLRFPAIMNNEHLPRPLSRKGASLKICSDAIITSGLTVRLMPLEQRLQLNVRPNFKTHADIFHYTVRAESGQLTATSSEEIMTCVTVP